ncbi:hypothetical protein Hypma_008877 [Hypsizygus marmoreus]|uniref:Uncharacterized protein n=1 Tax=Hypsizygus marmoreus TaxID=39966 RepID=A0A369JUJ5_HYPMA|nr:hypothetical protein Hypma_008877 [Hypsizygus marmoreus]
MPPKPAPEPRASGLHKRNLTSKVLNKDNIDASAIKKRKLAEAQIKVTRCCSASVEVVGDVDDDRIYETPRSTIVILKAADGSDDKIEEITKPGAAHDDSDEETEPEEAEEVELGM